MFRPGDKIKCVKGIQEEKLQEGTVYTVTETYYIDGSQVVVLKELGFGFLSSRFVKTTTDQGFTLDAAEN